MTTVDSRNSTPLRRRKQLEKERMALCTELGAISRRLPRLHLKLTDVCFRRKTVAIKRVKMEHEDEGVWSFDAEIQ